MTSNQIINCPYCFKIYKKKACYENHIFKCQRENKLDCKTPNNDQLYSLITNLTDKYNDVFRELQCLKNSINTKYKKLNVIEWLNTYEKIDNQCFQRSCENIVLNMDDLNIIFDNGFVNGVVNILTNNFINFNTLKCFKEKKNMIYVYYENTWIDLPDNIYTSLIKNINSQLLSVFKEYQDNHIEKMDDVDFHDKHHKNLTKLLCINIDFDVKCNRIKKKIYDNINKPIKCITEIQIE